MISFVLISDGNSSAKNALKNFSNYFKDIIFKMNKYPNYILMVINQNFLATLLTFSNLETIYMKNFIRKRQHPKLSATTKFLSKVSNRKT